MFNLNGIEIEIFKLLLIIIIAIVLPKKVLLTIRELLFYNAQCIFRFWFLLLLPILSLTTWFIFNLEEYLQISIFSLLALNVLIISLIDLILGIYIDLFKFSSKKLPRYGIAGCFSITKAGNIQIDSDSEFFNELLREKSKLYTSDHISFNSKLLGLGILKIPKFIPLAFGLKGLEKIVSWNLKHARYIAIFYCIRNVGNQNLNFIVKANLKSFNYTYQFEEAQRFFSDLSNDTYLSMSTVVECSVMFYTFLSGQSILDMLLDSKNNSLVKTVLQNSEHLLEKIFTILQPSIKPEFTDRFIILKRIWKGSLERYKGINFSMLNQPRDAIVHLLKSLKINPYFPFRDYNEFKTEYPKEYAMEVAYNMLDMKDKNEIEIDRNKLEEDYFKLVNMREIRIPPTINFITELIIQNDNKKFSDYVEQQFDSNFNKNEYDAVILMHKYDIFKYLQKGKDKINHLYIERIPECKHYLQTAISIDSDFPLLYNKLGAILLSEASMEKDEESKMKKFQVAFETMEKGFNVYRNLGIDV